MPGDVNNNDYEGEEEEAFMESGDEDEEVRRNTYLTKRFVLK